MAAIKENNELTLQLAKEKGLNAMLSEKTEAEEKLLEINKQRLERFAERLNNHYFHYEKHLHNRK